MKIQVHIIQGVFSLLIVTVIANVFTNMCQYPLKKIKCVK